ncbi:MAG: substrate-binding domain-containing protein [Fimbriimonadaceae bacterium]|nr:substrate-binding domain-containing protein [Fimbriimonadaceae bacterium]
MKIRWMGWVLVAGAALAGCSGGQSEVSGDGGSAAGSGAELPLVAFAQANSQDPWRQVFDAEMKATAATHDKEFRFELQDAQDDANKQIGLIETYLVKSPKVLLVSPCEVAVTMAVETAYDRGIPVILLDRAIESEKYTCWIGGDNEQIGRAAGKFMGEKLGGKGTVLMVQGLAGATPTEQRRNGFLEAIKEFPGVTVIEGDFCDYQRQKARSYMETFLQSGKAFDAVYAHNDEMAIGAYLALEASGVNGKAIVGIDACQQEIVDYIKAGKVTATFKYPTPGAKGIEVAAALLKGETPKEKKIVLETEIVTAENADEFLAKNTNLAK